jgi:Transposase DDE domain
VTGYHLQRLTSLTGLITGMLHTNSCHLSKIGSGLLQSIDSKSKETHAKRFLENPHIDHETYYLPYLQEFLSKTGIKSSKKGVKERFYLVIDGTQTGSKHVSLMLSVVVKDQIFPVFWEVRAGQKGHFSTEIHLNVVEKGVRLLEKILTKLGITPQFCLLGDGEFDSVDLQILCTNTLKIDYIFRTSCNTVFYEEGDEMRPKQLQKTVELPHEDKCFFIPDVQFSKQKLENVNFLYWFDEKKYEKPLFLISSLDNAPDIQAGYRVRFDIESLFKNLKSRGFNLHKNRLGSIDALTNLIMVVALAFCTMMNFGIENKDNPLKIKVQRIDKKVNSTFSFARELFFYCKTEEIEITLIQNNNLYQNLTILQT